MDAKDVAFAAVFTDLYFVINLVQAATIGNPAISGAVQLRIADCLIAVAAIFGWPAVVGVTVGGFLTNAYAFISPVDLALGPVANLVAASLVFLLRRHQLLACVVAALPIGFIVGGGYLWWYFPPPAIFGLELPVWTAMLISITISSLIATAIIGYALLRALSRPGIREPLKSRGLKTYS